MKAKLAKLIPHDKLLHLVGGAYIGLVALVVALIWLSLLWSALIALFVVVVIAGAIELVYDKWMKKGTPEWLDFYFTLGGGASVIALASLAIVLVIR